MKKILLATAALSAMTGFAAAEAPTVSGEARMGLVYDGEQVAFSSRIRVKFAMSGTTDGGLEFGASIRADQSGNGNAGADGEGGAFGGDDMGAGTVYISGAFGKLTFGDNDSAANVLVGHVSGVGLTGLGDANELRYLGQEDTSALYEYSTGALSFAVSIGQPANDEDRPNKFNPDAVNYGDDENDGAVSIAAKYSTDAFSVALGVERADIGLPDDVTHIALGGSATFGAATVKAVISDVNIDNNDTQFAFSVDYVAGAGTYTAFVTEEGDVNNFGLGAAYDLGGGASVKAGIVRIDGDNFLDGQNETVADLGVAMSF